jgi:hypothetical protein
MSSIKNLAVIPAAMRTRNQWLLWKYVARGKNGKLTKEPFQRNGWSAKSNTPSTWCDFESAHTTAHNSALSFDGIGFAFAEGDGLVGIDLDHCINPDGSIEAWAQEILDLFPGTYLERTPSLTGFHIICRGSALATGSKKWNDAAGQLVGIEVYDFKSPRYFTVTGDALCAVEPIDCQEQLGKVFELYYRQDLPKKKTKTESPGESKPALIERDVATITATHDIDPDEVRAALKYVNADDYNEWLKIGMAIKSADLPCDIWEEWSQSSSNYEADVCEEKWGTFHPQSLTISSLFYAAQLGGFSKANYLRSRGTGAPVHITKISNSAKTPTVATASSSAAAVTSSTAVSSVVASAGIITSASVATGTIHSQPIQVSQPAAEGEPVSNVVPINKNQSVLNSNFFGSGKSEHPHWQNYGIPSQYQLNEFGVARLGKDDERQATVTPICGPIIVTALTNNPLYNNGGLVIEFETKLNEFGTLTIPRCRLHQEPRLLAQDLATYNFAITPGKEKDLLVYLGAFNPTVVKIGVTQTGWAISRDPEELVFVWPSGSTHEDYFYQPDRIGISDLSTAPAGTLKQWEQNVYDSAPYPTFAMCCSLAAVLLNFAPDMSSVGINLFGDSTSGKTTLLQYAASVWGNGSDPAKAGSNPYTYSWNTTTNAMEALVASRNHMPFCIDEMGSSANKDHSRITYGFAGGQGKSALDASRTLKKQRTWQSFMISSGEVSCLEKMEESPYGGKKNHVKAGAAIRILDIPVKQGAIKSAAQANRIKGNASSYYGTLGPAYVNAIIEEFSHSVLTTTVQAEISKAIERMAGNCGQALGALQIRALKTFAIAEVAGLLLVHFKLLPNFSAANVREAIDTVLADWLPTAAGLTDAERALVSLRDFILKFQDSRFKHYSLSDERDKALGSTSSAPEKEKQQLAGYYGIFDRAESDSYFLFPEAFKEATCGETRSVLTVLKERGLLLPGDRIDRNTRRISLNGQQVAGYCIKAEVLGG